MQEKKQVMHLLLLAIVLPGAILSTLIYFIEYSTSDKWNLNRAIESGDIKTVKKIIAENKYVVNQGVSSVSPLHRAVFEYQYEIAELLLKHGARVNKKGGRHNFTPLFICAARNDFKFAALLLKYGASVEIRDDFGETAIDTAVGKGYTELSEYIKKYKQS